MNNKYSRYGACFLLLVFPSLCNLEKHCGSTILVLLTLMGLSIALSPKRRPSLTMYEKWVMWAFAGYFGVYLFSFALNGLLGNLPDLRLKYLDHEFRFLFVFPIFLLLRYLRISSGILWGGVTTGALVAGGYAICSNVWLSPGQRVSGGYHPIAFGDLSLAMAFMSIVSIDWYRRNRNIYLFVPSVASLTGLVASIMSGTRGAWIAIPGLLCVFFFYSAKFIRIGPRLLMVGACCVLAVAAYKIPATKSAGRLDLIITEIADYAQGHRVYTPITARIEVWRAALDIFYQNPLFGAGPGTYKPLLHEMVAKGLRHEIASPHGDPHSIYLAAMSDCGILGLIALLAMLGMPLWWAIVSIRSGHKVRDLGYAMVVLVVAFAHFGLTETIFGRNVNISFYVVMVASLMAVAANEKAAE